jgi:hypothetical protein
MPQAFPEAGTGTRLLVIMTVDGIINCNTEVGTLELILQNV